MVDMGLKKWKWVFVVGVIDEKSKGILEIGFNGGMGN